MLTKNQKRLLKCINYFILLFSLLYTKDLCSQDTLNCKTEIVDPIVKKYKNIDKFNSSINYNYINIFYTTYNSELNVTLYDTTEVILFEKIKLIKSKQIDIVYDNNIISVINHMNKTIVMAKVSDSLNSINYVSSLLSLDLFNTIQLECCEFNGVDYKIILNSLKFFQIPYKKSKSIFKINTNYLIDEVEEVYPSKGNTVTFKKRFVYNNLKFDKIYQDIKDYLFVNNKLIKKYENYKILHK